MTGEQRVTLVTGATSGIGRAVALTAARAGHPLVLVARGESVLLEVARDCQAAGAPEVLPVPGDLGDDAVAADAVHRALDRFGRLDVVVHCAGVVAYGRTEEVPVDVFDGVLRTNLNGSVNLARHVLPVLRRQGAGALVLVGSLIGHIGVPTMSAYVLSKWGVRALARQLQLENRDHPGIRICYLAPGGVDTPIYRQGANYSGFVGRPPPPVDRPERVARAALRMATRGRRRRQVGLANNLTRLGFTAFPPVYDALVGPLFAVAAKDRTDPAPPGPGNVLSSREGSNRLRGEQGSALLGVARNLLRVARSR